MENRSGLLVFSLFWVSIVYNPLFSQVLEPEQDSVRVIELERLHKKRKKERLNFRSFFRDRTMEATPVIKGYRKLSQKPYVNYEGKIIRKIHIYTLDPFDYTLEGESEETINILLKTGNFFHVKTREKVIRDFLLFKENQPFDSLSVKESERLIRSQSYTREVAMVIQPISERSDSVDVLIYELDRWSILPRYSSSDLRSEAGFRETNLLGSGHELAGTYNRYKANGDDNFNVLYFISNIDNTYINSTILYGTNEFKNKIRSIAFDRPFFSPLTQWAGGVRFTQNLRDNPTYANDSLFELRTYRMNTQDYWAGWSFRIYKKGHKNERITRLISSARFINITYPQKSIEPLDSLGIHSNEQFYLGTIGITKRKFLRDKFIFDYGITEDVPIGSLFSFTGGYQIRNNKGRYYFGSRLSYGNYFKIGYFSANFEYGSFFNQSKPEQSAFSIDINYFTGLIELGTWKFRQFVKTQTTIGVNRFAYEKLSFNDFYSPSVYNNFTILGTKSMFFTFQSQFYAPYKFLGFRFAPFFIYSLGMIGQQENRILDNRFYSQIGIGLLINNLNLVFNTFQVSIAFYPVLPDESRNTFGINPFRTANFGFGNFEIGKPSTLKFD
jgi:hypothetical protein